MTLAALCALTAFAVAPAAARAATTVNVQTDCHAAGNGTTDDTAAFGCAINLLSTAGGTMLVPAATYVVQPGVLVVPANVSVSGAGIGLATLKAGVVGEFMLDVQGANISVSGLTIEGANLALRGMTVRAGATNVAITSVSLQDFTQPTNTASPLFNGVPTGIRIEGNGNTVKIDTVSVKNVVALNTNGPSWPHKVARGIWIGLGSGQTTTTKNITIQNSTFDTVAPKDDGDCIVIQDSADAANLTITGNSFDHCYKRAIKIQVPGATVTNNKINNPFLNNTTYDTYPGSPPQDMWSAISVYASNAVVDSNTITSNGGGSFYGAIESDANGCSDLSSISITNNRVQMGATATTLVGASLIRAFAPVNGLTISNNTIDVAQSGIVVHPRVTNLSVNGNTIGPSVTSQFQYYGLTCAVTPAPLPIPSAAGVQTLAVPSYVPPGPDWSRLEAGSPTIGLTIINPFNGPGTFNFGYVNQVQQARAAGLTVLGYVHTSQGTRPSATVKTEIDEFYAWYDVDGIFFDEASTDCALEPYYADLNGYVKAKGGVVRTALNPGSATNECYMAASDILVTFEGTAADYASTYTAPSWVAKYPPNRFWHLVHTAATIQAMHDALILSKLRNAAWVYVTPNPGSLSTDNPWGSLAADPYWSAELATARLGTLVDLGAGTQPRAMNGLGEIVLVPQGPSGARYPSLYSNGTLSDLNSKVPAGSGWLLTEADAINDSGQIAGVGTLNGQTRAFLLSNGSVTDLGTLPGFTSIRPTGINNSGQVVGSASMTGSPNFHGFVWTPGGSGGTMRDIGLLPGGTRSAATAINDSGVVVGWADMPAPAGSSNPYTHNAFVWQNGALRALGSFFNGYNYSDAYGVSSVGRVVGQAAVGPHQAHAFFGSTSNVGSDLLTLGGYSSSATAVNAAGQVVGSADLASGQSHPFIWDATGGMRDLNVVLQPGSTWELLSAVAINGSGQVVGSGVTGGVAHTYLGLVGVTSGASPSPNPSPNVSALSPLSTPAGGGSLTLTVSGSGFVASSQVQWNGQLRPTTFVSGTQLNATIQVGDVASAGSAEVTVATPAPGGGTSTPQVFFITTSGAAVTSASSATSHQPQGSAQASTGGSGVGTPGSLSATATGSGTVTVAQYAADPINQSAPNGTTNYFDVHVSSNSSFTGLVLVDCNLTGALGTTGYGILYWWNGAVWTQAGPQKYDPSTNCTTLTISVPNGTPGLLQLAGTPFAVVVDRTPPTTTVTATTADGKAYLSGGWTNQTVTVSLSATDDLSGVKATYYALDSTTCSPSATTICTAYAGPFAISAEGAHSVALFSTDNAGNTESAKTLMVDIDKTPPVTNAVPSPGMLASGLPLITVSGTATVKDASGTALGTVPFTCFDTGGVKIGLAATDLNGSGPASVTYAASGGQTIVSTTISGASATPAVTTPGLTTLTYSAIDRAGNQEVIKTETIVVGSGFACAGPKLTFTAPSHGLLEISGTATTNGNKYPFSKTISF